jgi:hypothetical protein
MRNKSVDLHNILFEQLERLSDEDLEGAKLQAEIKRAEAMNKTAAQIINNGNLVLNALRLADEIGAGELPDMLNGGKDITIVPKKPKQISNR